MITAITTENIEVTILVNVIRIIYGIVFGSLSLAVLFNATPSLIANLQILTIKPELSLSVLSEEQYKKVSVGIDRAIGWFEDPEYYFLKERSLLRARKARAAETQRSEYYDQRIGLLVKGLSLASARPFELARLAHLYAGIGDNKNAKIALFHSLSAGPHIQNLYFTRFLTLSKIWQGIEAEDRKQMDTIIRLAYQHKTWKVIRVAKVSVEARKLVVYILKKDPKKLLEFYRRILLVNAPLVSSRKFT